MTPHFFYLSANGLQFAVYEWGEASRTATPPVIFFHATSFHGRCWDQVIAHLPGYHCYAVDARGHGRSAKPPLPYEWPQFGQDAAAIVQALGLSGAIGVGHSMGGNAITRAAASVPDAFSALVLIDPVIFPPDAYFEYAAEPEKHFTAYRRTHWASATDMFERFKNRAPFNTWDIQVLRDYCDYGLLPAADGDGYVLACSPALESMIYTTSRYANYADVYDAIRQIHIPVRILRCASSVTTSANDLMASPTNPNLVSYFALGIDVPLVNNTHFIPMESPALVAEHIKGITGSGVSP